MLPSHNPATAHPMFPPYWSGRNCPQWPEYGQALQRKATLQRGTAETVMDTMSPSS